MRSALLLGLTVLTVATALGCGDASTTSAYAGRRSSAVAAGEHDPDDVGDQSEDDGNPNADSLPPPPATPGTATGQLGVTLSNATPAVDLGEQIDIDVTIEPKGGFTGAANLTLTGAAADTVATFAPATVTLGAAPVTAKLTLKVPVTAVPSPAAGSTALVVTATAGTVVATANANFKINPKVKLTIPMNIDALRTTGTKFLNEWGTAFGATPTALKTQAGNPIVVTVFNADNKTHIVHGNNGFQHGSTTAGQEVQPNAFEMQNGAPRVRSLPPGANVNGYPHEGGAGQSAGFQISVVAAP